MSSTKINIEIDTETAILLDKLIRKSLFKKGLINRHDGTVKIEKKDIKSDKDIALDIDPVFAAKFSTLLREELITASAAHQANNENIETAFKKIAKKGKKK